MSNTKDPRPLFLNKINLPSLRVVFSPERNVLLCGGRVEIKERADDEDPKIYSLRAAIYKAYPNYDIFRPEEIQHWQRDGIYKNLVDFEKDLAGVFSLVVVILESPGSLAELGAFSQLPDLAQKLIVIKSKQFETPADKNSFINLGILRYISEKNPSIVKVYPWELKLHQPPDIPEETVNDVISDIQLSLDSLTKNPLFNHSDNSHVMILIRQLVTWFTALKESEIYKYLEIFKVVIDKSELRSKLFLLEELDILSKDKYSDSTFYFSGENKFHSIGVSLKDGETFDSLRLKMDCNSYYNESAGESHRMRLMSRVVAGGVK